MYFSQPPKSSRNFTRWCMWFLLTEINFIEPNFFYAQNICWTLQLIGNPFFSLTYSTNWCKIIFMKSGCIMKRIPTHLLCNKIISYICCSWLKISWRIRVFNFNLQCKTIASSAMQMFEYLGTNRETAN